MAGSDVNVEVTTEVINVEVTMAGAQGPQGDQGPAGPGVPTGGSTGQVLAKASATDFDTGWGVLTKSDVGLGNVDNTSDTSKPVSTAVQTALNAKEPTVSEGFTTQYWRGDKSWQTLNQDAVPDGSTNKAYTAAEKSKLVGIQPGAQVNTVTSVASQIGAVTLTKTDVGLTNVDNTSDATKPVSTAQAAADALRVAKAGDTMSGVLEVDAVTSVGALPHGYGGSATSTGVSIGSSYAGGDDTGSGTDSTGRLNLYSYQRANQYSYGETIRNFIMRKDAKTMTSWYGPVDLYDVNRDPIIAHGFKPWVWTGAHYESNGHTGLHAHWEIEVPDSTGAMQGRFLVPFGDTTTGAIGLDRTNITTNLADLTVTATNGQVLRIATASGANKDIQFSNDIAGSTSFRRWALRQNSTVESGANGGSDFQIVNYDDAGSFLSNALTIVRSTGSVGIGVNSPLERLEVAGNIKVAGKVVNVTDPTLAQDAATKNYVDGLSVFVRKTGDETVNNSSALQDDDQLSVSVQANSTYVLDAMLVYDSGTTPDIKIAFNGPASATLDWTTHGLGTTAAGATGSVTVLRAPIGDAGVLPLGGVGAGTKAISQVRGLLVTSSTAGIFKLRWAQNTADPSDTILRTNSYLRLSKVA